MDSTIPGRTSNQMIRLLVMYIIVNQTHHCQRGLPPSIRLGGQVSPLLHEFAFVAEHIDSSIALAHAQPRTNCTIYSSLIERTCLSSRYAQQYQFMRPYRDFAKHMFRPSPAHVTLQYTALTSSDIVVHIRHARWMFGREWYHNLRRNTPIGYYDHVLDDYIKAETNRTVYIICADSEYASYDVKHLVQRYKAVIHKGTILQDHLLGRNAQILVAAQGTFSWMMVYLSVGKELHVPYWSSLSSGSGIHALNELFIDDDDRIMYHNLDDDKYYAGTGASTLPKGPFADSVARNANLGGSCRL
jgi:hypothetical protein